MQQMNKNLDTQTRWVRQTGRGKEEEQGDGRNYQTVPGKEHPRVREERKRKMGWERRAVGGKEDEEGLKPKWQRPPPPPPPPLPWSRSTLLPVLLFHISLSLPPSLSLSLSISLLSCSLADLLRQRGEEFRRFKDCSVETACHVGATAALPADFTDSCCYNWSNNQLALGSSAFWRLQTAATSDSGAVGKMNSPSKLDTDLIKWPWTKMFGARQRWSMSGQLISYKVKKEDDKLLDR